MKDRTIIFSGPMVRALLDGRKTMTRRIAKYLLPGDKNYIHCESHEEWIAKRILQCPYGVTGDQLWVKETWRVGAWKEDEGLIAVDYKADGLYRKDWLEANDDEQFNRLWQQSTDDAIKAGLKYDNNGKYHWLKGDSPCRWRPSIFMPRWASRITLEITAVKVERLQEISEEDAVKEGAQHTENGWSMEHPQLQYKSLSTARSSVANYINKLHGGKKWNLKPSNLWDENPFCWAISFRRIKP